MKTNKGVGRGRRTTTTCRPFSPFDGDRSCSFSAQVNVTKSHLNAAHVVTNRRMKGPSVCVSLTLASGWVTGPWADGEEKVWTHPSRPPLLFSSFSFLFSRGRWLPALCLVLFRGYCLFKDTFSRPLLPTVCQTLWPNMVDSCIALWPHSKKVQGLTFCMVLAYAPHVWLLFLQVLCFSPTVCVGSSRLG